MNDLVGGERGKPRRVVVVDNDLVMREGTRTVLSSVPGIEVVGAIDHAAALSPSMDWGCVDVAVVDASDQRREVDQFPGVDVVSAIHRSHPDVVTVVLTGQYLHPGLRRRMWEAGADFFYARDEGMTEDELASVVLRPDEHRRMPSTGVTLPDELGVTPATRVNDLVERMRAPSVGAALGAERRKKADPHGERSRWWNRLRGMASGPGGLRPVKSSGASAPDLDAPSVVQLRKFFAAMTRVDPKKRA